MKHWGREGNTGNALRSSAGSCEPATWLRDASRFTPPIWGMGRGRCLSHFTSPTLPQHFCGVPEHNVAASHLMAASFSGKELDDRETGAHWHYAVFGGIVVDPIGFALNLIYAWESTGAMIPTYHLRHPEFPLTPHAVLSNHNYATQSLLEMWKQSFGRSTKMFRVSRSYRSILCMSDSTAAY